MKTLFAILLSGLSAVAGSVDLNWTPNPAVTTTNFTLYWGTNSGSYFGCTNTPATNFVFVGRAGVKYFLAVTQTDPQGDESLLSNEVELTMPKAKGPTLRITGTLQSACNVLGPWDDLMPFGEFLCEADQTQYFRVVVKQELLP